jgi:tight adherence protein B
MDLLTALLLCAVFLFTATIVVLIFLSWTESKFAEKRTVKKRLLYISAGGRHGEEKLSLYRKKMLRDVGVIERIIFELPRIQSLDRMLLKTGVPLNATTFLLGSFALGCIGLLVGLKYLPQVIAATGFGLLLLFLPLLWLKIAERAYYNNFQEQLPEALDLLARAVRSGHAITSGLEMIGQEMADPIRAEFAAVVDEVNLGLTLKEALDNLCERVPSLDIRFFAIAILLQKETGGNIAEILDNISRLLRERVQFARQVKALTAEGRYSAGVLISLPILMFIYVYFMNYGYISTLWTEKIGQYMLFGAVVLQIIGAWVIKRIVTIEI